MVQLCGPDKHVLQDGTHRMGTGYIRPCLGRGGTSELCRSELWAGGPCQRAMGGREPGHSEFRPHGQVGTRLYPPDRNIRATAAAVSRSRVHPMLVQMVFLLQSRVPQRHLLLRGVQVVGAVFVVVYDGNIVPRLSSSRTGMFSYVANGLYGSLCTTSVREMYPSTTV